MIRVEKWSTPPSILMTYIREPINDVSYSLRGRHYIVGKYGMSPFMAKPKWILCNYNVARKS